MSEYYYGRDRHSGRHRAWRRLKWLVGGALVLIPVIAALLYFTTSVFIKKETPPVTSGVQTKVQAPTIQIFRTPHFQFQAGKSWIENERASTPDMYVYQSFRGTLVEHDLTIYVNPTQTTITPLKATRIQAVMPKEDGGLDVLGDLSDHCKSVLKTVNQNPRSIDYHGVTFICQVDGAIFDVLVGKVGGTPVLDMLKPDGSKINIVLYYRDLRATAGGQDLSGIIKSFQTR